MGDLSAHFSRSEFNSHNGALAHPDARLIQCLEKLRAATGGHPLRIVSGYRDPAENRRVGGAPHSQHLINRAADIPAGYATVRQALDAGFTGVGHCAGWAVHVDVRDGRAVTFGDC